jgi:hypothetical protein
VGGNNSPRDFLLDMLDWRGRSPWLMLVDMLALALVPVENSLCDLYSFVAGPR